MAEGFEARARITADVSSFVGATRSAARAARMLAADIRTVRTNLSAMHTGVRETTASMGSLSTAAMRSANSQTAAAAASRNVSNAVQSQTEATQETTASLRALGNRLAQITRQQDQFAAVQREGRTLNEQQRTSVNALQAEYDQLVQRYNQLDDAGRAVVEHHRQLANAQQRSSETARANSTILRSLANAMADNRAQARSLLQVQRRRGELSDEERRQVDQLRSSLRELTSQYQRLDSDQRASVASMIRARQVTQQLAQASQSAASAAREQAQASQAAASAMRQVDSATNSATSGVRDFDSASNEALMRLYALRSAGEDLAQGLETVAFATRRAFTAVWDVFSRQETTIAHFSRITQESDRSVQGLASSIRGLAGEIPLAFEDLGEITVLGAQVGIANSRLVEFTDTVARFSETTPVAADEAATMFARIVEMTEVEQGEITELGAAISELGSNSSATEGEILKTVESIAVVATQAGLAETSILGLGAAMASLRIRPELARGAMQRSMHRLGEAAQMGGERVQTMSRMMGISQDEVANLQATNPDKFFFDLLESLNETATGAGDLTSRLRELGIVNTRDVDTISRLAANYELLEESVRMANSSFAEGTFLQKESERLFDTLTARVQILRNEWGTFLAMAFEKAEPLITTVVEIATAFASFLQATDPVSTTIVGLGVALTGLTAIMSTLGAGVARLGVGFVAFRGIVAQLKEMSRDYQNTLADQRRTQMQSTAATNRAQAAASAYQGVQQHSVSTIGRMNSAVKSHNVIQDRSTRAVTFATRALQTQQGLVSAAAGEQKLHNAAISQYGSNIRSAAQQGSGLITTQSAINTAMSHTGKIAGDSSTQVGALSTSMGHLRSAMSAVRTVASSLGVGLLSMGTIMALVAAIDQIGEAFKSTSTKIKEANQEFFTAAGGIDGLTDAILEDTAAMNQMQQETGRSTDSLALRTETVDTAAQSEDAFGRSTQEAANELEVLESRAGMSAASIQAAAKSADGADPEMQALADRTRELQRASDETRDATEGMNVALGNATQEFALSSAEAFILEQDIMQTGEAFQHFKDVLEEGGGLGTIVGAELVKAGTGAEFLREEADKLRDEGGIIDWLAGLETASQELGMDGFNVFKLIQSDAGEAADTLDGLADNLESSTVFIDEATNAADLFNKQNAILADGTVTTTEKLRELGAHGFQQQQQIMKESADEARAYGVTVEDLASSLEGFVNPVQAWNDAMDETTGTSEAAGQSLIDLQENASQHFGRFQTGMGNMQEAQMMWAENLMRLSGRVPNEVLAGLTEMGSEGAGIIAGLVDANKQEVDQFVDDWLAGGSMTLEQFSSTFASFMRQAQEAGQGAGSDLVDELLTEFRQGEKTIEEIGEQSGTAYGLALIEAVQNDEISFREAVDRMTEYSEENFAESDPMLQAQLETTEILEDLEGLMERIAEHFGAIDPSVVPELSDDNFREQMSNFETTTADKFRLIDDGAEVDPEFHDSEFREQLDALRQGNKEDFGQMDEDSQTEPKMNEDPYEGDSENLRRNNASLFDIMQGDSFTEPEVFDELWNSGLSSAKTSERKTFDTIRKDSYTDPEVRRRRWNSGLGTAETSHDKTITSIRRESNVSPKLNTWSFTSALSGLLGTARYYGSLISSALTVSGSVGKGIGVIGKAAGGWVSGPGGPTGDQISARLSDDEFVVRAQRATKFGPLLEAINSGSMADVTAAAIPNYVPDDIMSIPQANNGGAMTPNDIVNALGGVRDNGGGRNINVTVNNTYPQAEPTSISINRGLAYAGALDGVS